MQEPLWAVSTSCSGLLASTSTCLGLASLVFESSEEDCWITVADLSKFSDGEFAIDCSCLRRWKVYWTKCHLWSRFFIKFSIFNSVSRPWWWPKWVDLCLSGWQQIEWKPSSFNLCSCYLNGKNIPRGVKRPQFESICSEWIQFNSGFVNGF